MTHPTNPTNPTNPADATSDATSDAAPPAADAADPVLTLVQAWLAERDGRDGLIKDYNRIEGRLAAATEARGAVERRQEAARDRMAGIAAQVAELRSASFAGALGKLELALEIIEPGDCEDHARELVEGAWEELRASPGG